jgi:hypothetical protein
MYKFITKMAQIQGVKVFIKVLELLGRLPYITINISNL